MQLWNGLGIVTSTTSFLPARGGKRPLLIFIRYLTLFMHSLRHHVFVSTIPRCHVTTVFSGERSDQVITVIKTTSVCNKTQLLLTPALFGINIIAMRKNIMIRMTSKSSSRLDMSAFIGSLVSRLSKTQIKNSSKELVNAPEVVPTADWSTIYSANLQLGLNHSLWGSNSPLHRSLYCVHTRFDCFLLSLFLQN